MTTPRTTVRHECSLRNEPRAGIRHSAGIGRPRRKRCEHCGGALVILTGWHGVFVWRGDGRYWQHTAVSLHRTEATAQALIDSDTTGTLVIRWVPE